MTQTGDRNPNWKGGRVEDSGYVLVWISPTDPLASMRDRNGYVREHRLVVARHLDRPLLPSEIVHHDNGDTKDNRPCNLVLHSSQSDHMKEHMTPEEARERGRKGIETYRTRMQERRNERQAEIKCACGCGQTRLLFDSSGRRCAFIHGHNGRAEAALALIEKERT